MPWIIIDNCTRASIFYCTSFATHFLSFGRRIHILVISGTLISVEFWIRSSLSMSRGEFAVSILVDGHITFPGLMRITYSQHLKWIPNGGWTGRLPGTETICTGRNVNEGMQSVILLTAPWRLFSIIRRLTSPVMLNGSKAT